MEHLDLINKAIRAVDLLVAATFIAALIACLLSIFGFISAELPPRTPWAAVIGLAGAAYYALRAACHDAF